MTKRKSGYRAYIKIKGKEKHLGFFNTLKQAAVAYDHAVHKHRLPTSKLNFPTMKHNLNIRNQKEERNRKFRPLDFEVLRRVERSSEHNSGSMANSQLLAPSTPPKKQHAPMTKPFSNTTNQSPN